MSLEDLSFDPSDFSGIARLFPLPNLVVFPHVMQPLHIFEPRYRAMLKEAVKNDALIAMAVLAPGWENDYDGRPPIRSTACLCRVATHCKTEQGTYNALLVGIRRIRIDRELAPTKPFREAQVTLLDDVYPSENAPRRSDLQRRLVGAFRRVLPKLPGGCEQIEQLLGTDIPLGMLTDIVSYAMNLDQKIKEDLLAQPLPDLRALLLLECLGAKGTAKPGVAPCRGGFPPAFSEN
jgi:Lon protease-like protein